MQTRRLAAASALAALYVGLPTLLFFHQSASHVPATPWGNKFGIVSAILVFQPGVFVLVRLLPIYTLPVVRDHPLVVSAAIIVLFSALFWLVVFYLLLTALSRYKKHRSTNPRPHRRNPPLPPHVN